jgi:Tfp pilus assembly protein PilX
MPYLPSPCAVNVSRQRGAVLIITLIALVLIMISAVALIRSFDNSLSMSGNLAFKRDLINQGERGMADAIRLFSDGEALGDAPARNSDSTEHRYFATMQATNSRGIPTALMAMAENPGADTNDSEAKIRVVYMIDRLCKQIGDPSGENCIGYRQSAVQGGSEHLGGKKVGQSFQPIYRISVQATGPRNTEVYLQTTITR